MFAIVNNEDDNKN